MASKDELEKEIRAEGEALCCGSSQPELDPGCCADAQGCADAEAIRAEVNRFYEAIAQGEQSTEVSSEDLYVSLNYDPELLAQLPEEAKLGLSCGNPLEALTLAPGETLADLGSGAGMDLFLTRMKFPEAGTLYGIDRLPSMVEKARNIAARKGFKNVEFLEGDLRNLPLPDNSLNAVISNCVINLEPDKLRVYSEVLRVLKPGGRFILSDICLKKPLSPELQNAPNLYGT